MVGGLGNQLFQYSFGRALALRYRKELVLDIASYNNNRSNITKRAFLLNYLSDKYRVATFSEINQFNLLSILNKFYLSFPGHVVHKDKFHYQKKDIYTDNKINIYDGFWQYHKYFEEFSNIINNELFIGNPNIGHSSKCDVDSSCVAVHIRRGDYVSNKSASQFHGVLDKKYYLNAINSYKNHLGSPNFYFFSDDIRWCMNNFSNNGDYSYISPNLLNPWSDLLLMSSFSNHIISNSTYSWWAAWSSSISKHNNNLVIAPRRWHLSNMFDLNEFFPSHWEVMD